MSEVITRNRIILDAEFTSRVMMQLSPYDIKLMLFLMTCHGDEATCSVSKATIVKSCGLNKKTIAKCIDRLVSAGIIKCYGSSLGANAKTEFRILTDKVVFA